MTRHLSPSTLDRTRQSLVTATLASGLVMAVAAVTLAERRSVNSQAPAPTPTSFELIDRALKAGQIDEETAYKYRVLAGYRDTRLPAPYRGDDSQLREPPDVVAEAGARLKTFSEATRTELEPFFKRPDEAGSWITLGSVRSREEPAPTPAPRTPPAPPPRRPPGGGAMLQLGVGVGFWPTSAPCIASATPSTPQPPLGIQWQTYCAAGGHAKVWAQTRYPGDAAKAVALANALSTHIWDKLNNLMGPDPWTDNGFPSNGGDPALDFYLIRAPYPGEAKPSDPAQPCNPSHYILIDGAMPLVGSSSRPGILSTAAHELMHTIQFAYPSGGCPTPWIREASATWAENFVYPAHNEEHMFAPSYLGASYTSIDDIFAVPTFRYGAYLLPYFQEKTARSATFMHTMWANFATMSALAGIDAVLSGGWDQTWPKFLIHNWNQRPIDNPNGYKGWDQMPHGALPWQGVEALSAPMVTSINFPQPNPPSRPLPGLPYLAGFYKHFTFDHKVRSVLLTNTIAAMAQPHTSVWGIEKVNGTWKQPIDLMGDFQRTWCRDRTTENLEELVLIFGNSDWQTRKPLNPPEPPSITTYSSGCTAYVGTITVVSTLTSPELNLTARADATVRFEPDPDLVNPGGPTEHWRLVSGNITWSANASGQCTGSASGVIPIRLFGGSDQNHMAMLWIADMGQGLRYSGSVGPIDNALAPKVTVTCPGTPPSVFEMPVLLNWWETDPQGELVPPGGKTLSGTYTVSPNPGISSKSTWTLRASP